jgi:hypothetical protein
MIARIVSLAVGLWLMAAPVILDYHGPGQINDRICGPLIASLAIIAVWEVTREVRWVNTVFAFWLIFAPLFLHYITWRSVINSLICAFILLLSSLAPGRRTHSFNGGWTTLVRKERDDRS